MDQVMDQISTPKEEELLSDFFESLGKGEISDSFQRLLGFSDNSIECLYGVAYTYYNQGKFTEGEQLFRLLVLVDPLKKKYWMGLAGSQHLNEHFDDALQSYAMAGLLEGGGDPYPHFHAADCYVSLENYPEAIKALDAAVACLNEGTDDPQLRQRIGYLHNAWTDRIEFDY